MKEIPDEKMMKTKDYDFDLPPALIAQTPIEKRDNSRLLVLDKKTGGTAHRQFYELPDLLTEKDCLILNNSKVLPARIYGVKEETGAVVEFLLLKNHGNDIWETLAGPGKRAKAGSRFSFGEGKMYGEVMAVLEDGSRMVQFEYAGLFYPLLDEIGQMPLPPYIKETLEDQSRYQTVYAKEIGSAAAPTAGLHFTAELLAKLKEKGVKIGFVTLHVGLSTFRPVSEENVAAHKMHSEHYHVPADTAKLMMDTRNNGGRVIAVGTTSCRTIESAAKEDGTITECEGDTEIFIYPGYDFKGIDGLITNFHLPESTLIMLVSALAGREHVLAAYQQAIEKQYRFFSFGDAMFIC